MFAQNRDAGGKSSYSLLPSSPPQTKELNYRGNCRVETKIFLYLRYAYNPSKEIGREWILR